MAGSLVCLVVLWNVSASSEGIANEGTPDTLACCGADFAPGLRKVLKSASLGCALGLKELHMHLNAIVSCAQSWLITLLHVYTFNLLVWVYVDLSA